MASLLLLSMPHTSQANEMVGAVSNSLGGTGRAAGESNESLFLNPAAIGLLDRFYTGSFWQTGFIGQDIQRTTYGMTLTDASKDMIIPGSLSFRRNTFNQGVDQYKENEFKAGFSVRWSERWHLGIGASHLRARGPDGARHNQNNIDLGLLTALTPNWGLSLSWENLLAPDGSLPEPLVRNSYVALGTQYVYDNLLVLRYEALLPIYIGEVTQYVGHRAGVAVTMRGGFQMNLGYSLDDSRRESWASGGLVWRGPRLRLAYSYQKEERQALGDRHMVDLWFDF